MTYPSHAVEQDLVRIRANLMKGRGVGASKREVVQHTRDRPRLGMVSTAFALERLAQDTQAARAGAASAGGMRRLPRRAVRIVAGGAVITWVLASAVRHKIGKRRSRES